MSTKAKGFQATIEAKSFSKDVQPGAFNLPKTSELPPVKPTPTMSKEASNISMFSSSRKVNISVTSNPQGAAVYLDNTFVGNAPLSQQMPLGIYLVRCVLDGYVDTHTSVGVTEAGAEAGVLGAGAVCNMKPLISQG